MLDRIIQLALTHRLVVIALAALVLVYGAFVATRLPVDVFPDLNRPTITILTESGGLSPEEVEALVTTPIERSVNGSGQVVRVRSTSAVGLSVVWVELAWDADLVRERQLVVERLQLAKEQLPAGINPVLAPIASIMGEIMLLAVQSDDERTSPLELRSLADWVIRPRLLTQSGVAQVTVMGGGEKQFQVEVDPAKLLAHGVTFEEVERTAAMAQANTTGGFLDRGTAEYLIRNLARVTTPAGLADTAIRREGPVPIRIGDVAEVRIGKAPARGDAGMNGAPAVILAVQKQPGASTVDLTRRLEKDLSQLELSLPPDIHFHTLFRQATFIEAAIDNVVEALRDGAILVVIVLFLFLLNLRTTLITLTAIPLSLAITAIVMHFFGISVNTMTLGGLAVAIGEVVDDAIVDVENVLRRLKENSHAPPPPAAAPGDLFGQLRGPQLDRLRDHHRGVGLRALVCPGRHRGPPVFAVGLGLRGLDRRLLGGLFDRNPGLGLLPPAERQGGAARPRRGFGAVPEAARSAPLGVGLGPPGSGDRDGGGFGVGRGGRPALRRPGVFAALQRGHRDDQHGGPPRLEPGRVRVASAPWPNGPY
jgi:Cu/Ag efflux pump CusA